MRWDAATAQKVESLSFLGTNHSCLHLSSDGRWLALGDTNANIQVWDFNARRLVTNLVSQEWDIFDLSFSPRATMLNCGAMCPDGRLVPKFWTVAGWREISLRSIKFTNLTDFVWSPNDRTVAFGYGDGAAAWWDLATGQMQHWFDCHYASGVRVAFSPDGRLFATAGYNGLMTVWDVRTLRPKPISRGYRNALHYVALSRDGRRLVATGTSPHGLVKIWDVETGRDMATLPGEPGWFWRIGFSPDGNTLFATSLEGTALLWRAPSWEEIEAKEKDKRVP
jgi:WD40 repeat protein